MIQFVSAEATLELRSRYLRAGIDPDLCRFEGDESPATFHIAYFADGSPVSIASFMKTDLAGHDGIGYQLRGMATDTSYQRRGLGSQILKFAVEHLKSTGVNYLWCNARQAAYKFYQSIGFVFASDEFDIAGIGIHRKMVLVLN